VQVVCRDGSGAYAEAVRRALPGAVQVSDRWHLWHGLAEAVLKEVAAHSARWAGAGPPPASGRRAQTTLERWQQVHDLPGKGVGLLECARRLDLSLNTVKRYARATQPERLQRAPQYRPTLVDPYRDHLRRRRTEDPAVRSGSCCGRSGNSATRAARTCSSGTSPRAASRPTARTCHPDVLQGSCACARRFVDQEVWATHVTSPDVLHGSCSPGPPPSRTASTHCSATSPPHAPR
jgi:hypothetical protein